jgi:glycosyltransferase involved in cell wall biosynthesis
MISIIIPVYNAVDTVEETINSAIQSGVDTQEIILVDDASTDGSLKILETYRDKYSFISLYKNKKNLGGGAARNVGISHAKYEYIFVLDSDDILVHNSLPRALEQMLEIDADGIANGFASCFIDNINHPTFTHQFISGPIFFEALFDLKPNPVIGNLLFKRDVYLDIGGYPEHHGFDTQSFGFRLLSNNKKIHVCDFQIYHQRLPRKPSYYIREMRAGNLNKNWFYILFEHLYKFSPEIRDWILNYPVSDPVLLAKGQNMFTELTKIASNKNIFCVNGVKFNDDQAYDEYKTAHDELLNVWCLSYEMNQGVVKNISYKVNSILNSELRQMLSYVFMARFANLKLNVGELDKFQYFFCEKKSLIWTFRFYVQKIFNRMGRLIGEH